MQKYILIDDQRRQNAINFLLGLELGKFQVEVKPIVKDRSLSQNRLSFKWYSEIGKQSGNGNDYERNYYKYHVGCQILARDDSDFAKFYFNMCKRYAYEERIEAMEYVEVTRLMGVKQFKEYLEGIELDCINRGFALSHPEDLYFEALMRDR